MTAVSAWRIVGWVVAVWGVLAFLAVCFCAGLFRGNRRPTPKPPMIFISERTVDRIVAAAEAEYERWKATESERRHPSNRKDDESC